MRSSAGDGACGVGCRELSSADAAAAGREGGLWVEWNVGKGSE